MADDRHDARVGGDEVGGMDRLARVGAVVVGDHFDGEGGFLGAPPPVHRELDGSEYPLPLGGDVPGQGDGHRDADGPAFGTGDKEEEEREEKTHRKGVYQIREVVLHVHSDGSRCVVGMEAPVGRGLILA